MTRALPYHRVNLEQQLLKAAAEIVARQGVQALSLRGLGAAAGVSRSAAYHYFTDKADLLARVGALGFVTLEQYLNSAIEGRQDPLLRARAGFAAYVDFAREHPALFQVMFANLLPRTLAATPEAAPGFAFSSPAALACFSLMVRGLAELRGLTEPEVLLEANVVWAFVHGLAVLSHGDNVKFLDIPTVLERGLDALLAPPPS